MTEFGDVVPHTGGVLTIAVFEDGKGHRGCQAQYVHHNANRATLIELVAVNGEISDISPTMGIGLNSQAPPPMEVPMLLPSDAEGMFGRRCPECGSYFR